MTPEELVPLLLDLLPATKRNLDATAAKNLAEAAKIADDLNFPALRDQCMQNVEAIMAAVTPAAP